MIRFALRLVRPYWKWLLIVIGAMLVNTAMGLASPWPLKIVLDAELQRAPRPGEVRTGESLGTLSTDTP